jgi:hypothetical protein
MATYTAKLVFDVEAETAADASDKVEDVIFGGKLDAELDAMPGGWVIVIEKFVE